MRVMANKLMWLKLLNKGMHCLHRSFLVIEPQSPLHLHDCIQNSLGIRGIDA